MYAEAVSWNSNYFGQHPQWQCFLAASWSRTQLTFDNQFCNQRCYHWAITIFIILEKKNGKGVSLISSVTCVFKLWTFSYFGLTPFWTLLSPLVSLLSSPRKVAYNLWDFCWSSPLFLNAPMTLCTGSSGNHSPYLSIIYMRVRSVSDCPTIKTIAPGPVAFKNKMNELAR